MTGFFSPTAVSGSTNVVAPPNVNPMNGLICHSALAWTGAEQQQRKRQASRPHLPDEDAQKQPRERRQRHIALFQMERFYETVTVRHQDEREPARG